MVKIISELILYNEKYKNNSLALLNFMTFR